MNSGPETRFIASIHRRLPKELHWEKMANPYRGGTADCWYSGKNDLWIEWKYIELPKRESTILKLPLSALQDDWLRNRWNEGRNVWVIVGCKEGGVRFAEGDWHIPMTAGVFKHCMETKDRIAMRILAHCQA
jgi:hypothetical protein